MNKRRLLKRLSQGALHNVAFNDRIGLVEGFGFNLLRVAGSHHVFGHPGISELVNLQEVKRANQAVSDPAVSQADRAIQPEAGGRVSDYHIKIFYSEEDGGYIADIRSE